MNHQEQIQPRNFSITDADRIENLASHRMNQKYRNRPAILGINLLISSKQPIMSRWEFYFTLDHLKNFEIEKIGSPAKILKQNKVKNLGHLRLQVRRDKLNGCAMLDK